MMWLSRAVVQDPFIDDQVACVFSEHSPAKPCVSQYESADWQADTQGYATHKDQLMDRQPESGYAGCDRNLRRHAWLGVGFLGLVVRRSYCAAG